MKLPGYLFCILLFAACGGKKKPTPTAEINPEERADTTSMARLPVPVKAFQIGNIYTVIDTGKYVNEGPMTGGSYVIIQKNNVTIDTISLGYGFKALGNDLYLYQKLAKAANWTDKLSIGELALEERNYILITGNTKSSLKNETQNFDDNFSSPNVLNHKVYFWQLEKMPAEDKDKISAAEFDPATRKTNTHFLLNDVLDTDDTGYFTLPYLQKDTIIFTMDGIKKWRFSSDFKAY